MAAPQTTNKLAIYLGDGATPTEVFGAPCGGNAVTATFTTGTGEVEVLDCDDPFGSPAIIQRWVTTVDMSMSISGVLALSYVKAWRDWADSGAAKNIRVVIDESAASGGGYYSMPAILTSLEWGREMLSKVTLTASIVAAGPRTWTDAS